MRTVSLLLTFFVSIALATTMTPTDELSRQEIQQRLAPLTEVCLTGDECAQNTVVVSSGEPRTGEQIYNKHCTACHSNGLLGAPKANDKPAWAAAEKTAGGYSALLANAISGIRSMPAKGTCMDCSEDEISNAIQYMSGLKP